MIPEDEKREIFSHDKEGKTQPSVTEQSTVSTTDTALSDTQTIFLAAIFNGDQDTAKSIAKQNSLSYLALGEGINEFFADTLGDVVLLLHGDLYEIVPDYEEEIRAVLSL